MNNQRKTQCYLKGSRQQRGFSLVEIMVGLTVGLVLMTGIIQLFVRNNTTYRIQTAFSRMQENGRFAIETLNNNLRMATYFGCSSSNTKVNVLNNSTDWWKNFAVAPLRGYDGTSGQTFPAVSPSTAGVYGSSAGNRKLGTDAIISLGGGGGYSIISSASGASPPSFTLANLTKPTGGILATGDMVIVCDTLRTSLFQITRVQTAVPLLIEHIAGTSAALPGNSVQNLFPSNTADTYDANSTVVDYIPTAFFIGPSTSAVTNSLYQIQLTTYTTSTPPAVIPIAQEVVEGVDDMQIFYGVDTSGDGIVDQYQDATNVANWANVLSVRVYLLMSYKSETSDNLVGQLQTYIFPNDVGDSSTTGRIATAPDLQHVYQVFSTTIGIRNRSR
ncbi:type IV pilus assembly protein PilW [Gammaproteobacteria bacterium]